MNRVHHRPLTLAAGEQANVKNAHSGRPSAPQRAEQAAISSLISEVIPHARAGRSLTHGVGRLHGTTDRPLVRDIQTPARHRCTRHTHASLAAVDHAPTPSVHIKSAAPPGRRRKVGGAPHAPIGGPGEPARPTSPCENAAAAATADTRCLFIRETTSHEPSQTHPRPGA